MTIKTLLMRRDFLCVLILLVFTLPFFLTGFFWGMPNNQHGDEWAILNSTLMLPFRKGDPRLYFYGVPFMYLYATLIGALFAFYSLMGWVGSIEEFSVLFLKDPTVFVIAGRLISLTFATATLILTFVLARRFLPRSWSLLAAISLGLSSNYIIYAQFAKIDQMLVFLYTLTTYLLITGHKSPRRIYLACMVAGAALATKLPALALGLPILAAVLIDNGGLKLAWKQRDFWLAPLLFLAGFFLVNPWVLIRLVQAVLGLDGGNYLTASMEGFISSDSYKSTPWENALFYGKMLAHNHGLALMVLTVLSPLILLIRRERGYVILLAAGWAMVPMALLPPRHDSHWILAATPALLLAGLVFINEALLPWKKLSMGMLVVLLLAGLVPQAIGSADMVCQRTLPRTEDLAKEWVENNIEPGTALAMDSGRYLPTGSPALLQCPEMLQFQLEEEMNSKSDPVAGGKLDHFFKLQIKANQGRTCYNIYPILHGIPWKTSTHLVRNTLKSMDEYRGLGVKAIIISDRLWKSYRGLESRLDECHNHVADYISFRDEVLPGLPVLAEFKPEEKVSRGPVITIYGLDP